MHIGIIGTGVIATSFSALFTGNGHRTTITGLSEMELEKLHSSYAQIFDALEDRGLVTQVQREKSAALLSVSTRYEDLSDTEIIFEAVYEDLNIKSDVYRQIEKHCPNVKVIASSTSALAPDDLKTGFNKLRDRLVVAHPYHPAHLAPLVELVGSTETSAETMSFVKEFLESCGRKVCLMKKSVPGFIANRLQHAMLREALYLIQDGVATAAEIDMALTFSFIPRYTKVGFLQHQDGYGLDMLEGLQNYLYPHLCTDKGASPLVSEAVKNGNLGQKTGKGLHEWTPETIAEFRRGVAEPYWHFFNWNIPS